MHQGLIPSRGGRLLPLYRCLDPLSGGHLLAFTDPGQLPAHGDEVIVTDGLEAWLCRYRDDIPVPEGYRLLGVARMLCVHLQTRADSPDVYLD